MATTQHVDQDHPPAAETTGRPQRPRRSTLGERRLGPLGLAVAAILLLALAGPLVGTAGAQPFQSVNPALANQVAGQSQQVLVTFRYDASSQNTTGLGLRIHFNSSKLTYLDFPFVFGPGGGSLFVMGPSDEEDETASDGDPNTNKMLLLAWVHTESGFTGTSLPTDLFTVRFTTAANFSGSTTVRVTAVDNASGYSFSSTPATITAPGAPTPTPTATPPPTTPTPTPTPGGATAELDIDHDGEVMPFSDGLLAFRYLAGFRGANLVEGAVDTGDCTAPYCTAPGIEAYIVSILPLLDIDHDGETMPFSDGLLIFRYLVGFRGANLVEGAVDTGDCTPPYCTAPGIETYLLGLTN